MWGWFRLEMVLASRAWKPVHQNTTDLFLNGGRGPSDPCSSASSIRQKGNEGRARSRPPAVSGSYRAPCHSVGRGCGSRLTTDLMVPVKGFSSSPIVHKPAPTEPRRPFSASN